MKKVLCVIFILSTLVPTQTAVTAQRQVGASAGLIRRHERSIPGSYLVVLKTEVGAARVASLARDLATTHGGRLAATYRHALRGFSVRLSEKRAEALSRHPLVEYVEEDAVVETASVTQQNAPWGLDRIDQRSLPLSTTYTYGATGAGVHAYIIDSGIRTTHEEFGGRASVAFDNVGDSQNGEDCHGHGTKVASVVGGQTYGVAKGVELHAVRIFNCLNTGSSITKLVEAIDFITGEHQSPAVVVLSISATGSSTLDTAIQNSIAAGLSYVVAAGNGPFDAATRSPSRIGEAIVVGATDNADARATFSNYGTTLDLFAPGVNIPAATYFNDTATAVDSGTSLAAAHAAGVAATYLETHIFFASPAEVHQALVDRATTGVVSNPGTGSPNRLLYVIDPPQGTPAVVATKTDSFTSQTGVASPGDTITYTVVISNAGAGDAANVVFVDSMDPNTTLVPGSVSAPNATFIGGMLNVNVGTLPANRSVTITFQVTVNNPYTGGPDVSNQGLVYGANVPFILTDDPSTGMPGDATRTPVSSTEIRVNDARLAEPDSPNTAEMAFTVSLSQPANGPVSVDFTTADGTATAGTCGNPGADYVTTSGQVAFSAGQQVKTINVPICSDAFADDGETFFVNLSGAAGGTAVDAQGTGTITPNTPGTFIISELRTRGPAGAGDDFVELYNNTDSPLTVAATDASAGYGVFKMGADCTATPVLIGTIPNGTIIPARGHYLMVGSQYSLTNYGGTGAAAGNLTMTSDIENDRNVGVFATANVSNVSSANRLDAVGFGSQTGAVCALLREGANLAPVGALNVEYSYFRKQCDFVGGAGCTVSGNPKETNDNAADFAFADTQGTFISGVTQRLGAPGPENLASPIRRDDTGVLVTLLDSTKSSSSAPNRQRDTTPGDPNTSPLGTLSMRRKVQNTTGATITRLRFRIVEMTTFPSPGGGVADLRVITSSAVIISGITDAATCASTGTPTTAPCQVTAQATTLEAPPNQPMGGGYNSTVSVSIPGGLANNASVNVNITFGMVQSGTFRFFCTVEALP